MVEPTPLKNISQNGNLPQIGGENKNIWNHHPVYIDQLASYLWLFNDCPDFPGQHVKPRRFPPRFINFKKARLVIATLQQEFTQQIYEPQFRTFLVANFGTVVGEKKSSQSTPTKWWPFSNMLQNRLSPNHAPVPNPPKSQNHPRGLFTWSEAGEAFLVGGTWLLHQFPLHHVSQKMIFDKNKTRRDWCITIQWNMRKCHTLTNIYSISFLKGWSLFRMPNPI